MASSTLLLIAYITGNGASTARGPSLARLTATELLIAAVTEAIIHRTYNLDMSCAKSAKRRPKFGLTCDDDALVVCQAILVQEKKS